MLTTAAFFVDNDGPLVVELGAISRQTHATHVTHESNTRCLRKI